MDVPQWRFGGMKKEVLLDSSSAILLEKSGLLDELLAVYRIIMSEAVYLELTENSYPSADIFEAGFSGARFEVQQLAHYRSPGGREKEELAVLGKGEQETIQQFLSGTADFIMLDDGKGARFCSKHCLPFINALLFPKILNVCGRLSQSQFFSKTEKIIRMGRYSQKIVEMAEGFSRQKLLPFLP
jgi:hypothetical protein